MTLDAAGRRLAEHLRAALIARGAAAHEDARLRGLCCEGAWEAALSAMRALDLEVLASELAGPAEPAAPVITSDRS